MNSAWSEEVGGACIQSVVCCTCACSLCSKSIVVVGVYKSSTCYLNSTLRLMSQKTMVARSYMYMYMNV